MDKILNGPFPTCSSNCERDHRANSCFHSWDYITLYDMHTHTGRGIIFKNPDVSNAVDVTDIE